MQIKNSTDWNALGSGLHAQFMAAPQRAKSDLAKMYARINSLVTELSREEVELRRNKRETSLRHQELLIKINEAVDEFEKWLVFAQLSFA
jgi:hypothetical protein